MVAKVDVIDGKIAYTHKAIILPEDDIVVINPRILAIFTTILA